MKYSQDYISKISAAVICGFDRAVSALGYTTEERRQVKLVIKQATSNGKPQKLEPIENLML